MSSSERTQLKSAISKALRSLSANDIQAIRDAYGINSSLTMRAGLDRLHMHQIRSLAKSLSITVEKEPVMTAETQELQAAPAAQAADANTGGIEIKREFEMSIDALLGPATGGKVTSLRQIISTMMSLKEEANKGKEMASEVARLQRELAMKPSAAPITLEAAHDGSIPSGKMEMVSAKDIFVSASGAKSDKLGFNVPSFKWDAPHPMVPAIDPNYVFRIEHLISFLYALSNNKNAWLYGHTGTGKTTFVEQVAARLGYPVMRVNMDNDIERSDFLGSTQLMEEKGATVSRFHEGVLPRAMQQGCILLVDEMDFGKSGIMYVMQRALEAKGLLLTEDGGRLVTPHPMFRIVATANTRGQGDEYGCYPGARVQSNALLDRFTVWMNIDYMSEAEEHALLKSSFPTMPAAAINQLTLFAREIRKAFLNRELLMSISPRSLLSIGESSMFYSYVLPPETAMQLAIETTYIEKATDDTKTKVIEIANRCFKSAAKK